MMKRIINAEVENAEVKLAWIDATEEEASQRD